MIKESDFQEMQNIGVDIVEIDEFREKSKNQALIRKVFADSEVEYCNSLADPVKHLAARWAAKEAIMKASGAIQRIFFDNIVIDDLRL